MIRLNIKPISVNESYKGRRFRTAKYELFIKKMMLILPALNMPKTNISLSFVFGFSSKLSDIDNALKSTIDCLTNKYGVDDRNIFELHVRKVNVKKGFEFIEFEIRSLDDFKNKIK